VIAPEIARARRVLAVRLDNLGDVLLMTPALRAIRRALPGARLALWTSPVGADVALLDPDVDEIIATEVPWVDPWRALPDCSARERDTIDHLRAGRFDAAFIFTSFRQSPLPAAYACYLADIPMRIAATTDGAGSLLTTRHRPPDRVMHEVERALDLVGAVGIAAPESLDLVLEPSASARAEGRRLRDTAGSARAVVIHPGCSMPARTYPLARFAQVAELLAQDDVAVFVTGGPTEVDTVADLLSRVAPGPRERCIGAAGLPFELFCGLVAAADAVVTNNTGPMHVAAALKTPVVALFALTNPPEQWRPWRATHRLLNRDVPCRLCYSRVCPTAQECLEVPPDEVAAVTRELVRVRETAAVEAVA
jgi:ADP-heptose:LPS heptosyltransferase